MYGLLEGEEEAKIAQLGERMTEDHKVRCSIHLLGAFFFLVLSVSERSYYGCFDGMLVFVDTGGMDSVKRKRDRLDYDDVRSGVHKQYHLLSDWFYGDLVEKAHHRGIMDS